MDRVIPYQRKESHSNIHCYIHYAEDRLKSPSLRQTGDTVEEMSGQKDMFNLQSQVSCSSFSEQKMSLCVFFFIFAYPCGTFSIFFY
jgi:hypothetical protein